MLLLTSCDYNIEFSNIEYISDIEHLENIVEVTNNLGEQYRIEYEKRNGFPSMRMDIKIFKSEEFIINYWTKYDGNYIPNKILYLFTDDYYYDYYFISDYFHESITKSINAKNELCDPETIDVDWSEMKNIEYYISMSKTMQKNIDRQELIDKFKTCEYDDKYILELYDLYK